jgi:hypothetical protein
MSITEKKALDWWSTNFPGSQSVGVSHVIHHLNLTDDCDPKMVLMLLVQTGIIIFPFY